MSGGADGGERRFRLKPRARRDVKDVHTGCNTGGPQQEGHEMRGDVREGSIEARATSFISAWMMAWWKKGKRMLSGAGFSLSGADARKRSLTLNR